MADLVITTADLELNNSRSRPTTVQAGLAVSIGQAIYLDTTTGKYSPADADLSATADVAGIAITSADADGYLSMLSTTDLILGATLVTGDPYFLSTNAGSICSHSDLGAGDYVTLIGFASSTSVLELDITATGIVI